jgi:HSF-type DNA-binding
MSSKTGTAAAPMGLSHLMEAATALAELTTAAAPTPRSLGHGDGKKLSPTLESKVSAAAKDSGDAGCGGVVADSDTAQASDAAEAASKEIFPCRLMAILNDPTLSDVVTWLPHGRSFVVLRPDIFTEQVLPKYVPSVDARAAKYPSFTRKVNRW